jgi:hypothetical protein
VCENRIIRRIFGPKRDVVTGEWMKYTVRSFIFFTHPQNIIRQIKSKNMRWVGHVAHMGEESVQGFGEKPQRKDTIHKTRV